ncbi:Hsp20/alpha crystallin family protein [Nannocystis pusilla]|uniref:Hsp20/alpha crystallin family protein n=1 Tax=Nannocystis pusilla TaxID=889268 RepID=UPI003BEFECD4
MSLIPWKKSNTAVSRTAPVAGLSSEMNRLFNQFFDDFRLENFAPFPALSVSETAKTVLVTAEVPGIAAADLDVSIDGNLLTIRGQKREEKRSDSETCYHLERSFGSFMRRVELPASVDAGHIEATLDKGVLTLVLPKNAGEGARSIAVQTK